MKVYELQSKHGMTIDISENPAAFFNSKGEILANEGAKIWEISKATGIKRKLSDSAIERFKSLNVAKLEKIKGLTA